MKLVFWHERILLVGGLTLTALSKQPINVLQLVYELTSNNRKFLIKITAFSTRFKMKITATNF